MAGKQATATASGGVSFMGLLAILFIGLKLTGFVEWSWWAVLAPLWLPAAVCLVFAGLCFAVYGVLVLLEKRT